MFGSDLIIGNSKAKLDNKRRVFMPNYTFAEAKDKVLIQVFCEENIHYLKIFAYQKYFEIMNRFKQLRDNSTNLEDYNKFDLEIEKICSVLQNSLILDNSKRLIIPKETAEMIDITFNDTVILTGLGTSLKLKKYRG